MPWADNNYNYKKKITIDFNKVAANHTDFPVLIKFTDADLTGCLANGYDIKFYDDTETLQLKHERIEWNNATGFFIAWVKIPSLSSLFDTDIYIYYEYPGETIDQQDKNNTWNADFLCVMHCNSPNTQQDDSTSNAEHYPEHNNPIYRATGKIGYCADISANIWGSAEDAGATIHCWENTNIPLTGLNAMTIEAWAKPSPDWDAYNGGGHILQFRWSVSGPEIHLVARVKNSLNNAGFQTNFRDLSAELVDDSIHNDYNGWYHGVGTHSNADSEVKLYVNGLWRGTNTPAIHDYSGQDDRGTLGARRLNVISTPWSGYIEEARISTVVRDTNWVYTNYQTQNNPSGFYVVGPEETKGPSTYQFKFPIKKHTQYYKYDDKKIQSGKYKHKIGKDYKYKIK